MFGRIVACAASVCALWSLLAAGDARALPRSVVRSGNQYSNHNQSGQVRPAEHQTVAWPPRRLSRQRLGTRPKDAARAGRFGDAFMVDTGVTTVPALGSQYSYGAASNGEGWRVMWSDDNDYSVRTSGIGTDGTLLEARGSLVGHEQYQTSGLTLSLVGTGSGFIAVWTAGYDQSIWAARLDSAGTLIDSVLVFESDSGQGQPAVAFDGDSICLVVWAENLYGATGGDIYAARVTTGGRVLDPVPFPVAQESSQLELWPTVAFGQGVYLAAWTSIDTSWSSFTAKAVRVSAGGVVLDTAIFLRHDPAMLQLFPAVAFGDTCFLASWSEGMQEPDVYAARVSASGNLIDTAGIQLCSGPTVDMLSSVGFDGTTYLIMWCEGDTISYMNALRGRRMTTAGVPLDSGLIRPELPGYTCIYPSVAADQANFLVAFDAADTFSYDDGVGCVRISPDGAVLDSGIFFPLGADAQTSPSGASDGTDFLAAWFETQRQGQAVHAARISADGTVLDPVGFLVNDAPGQKYNLATGFGDSLYLVAWADYRGIDGSDIYCARVGRDGQVLDPDGIVVCDESLYQDLPDISFDGQNFLVVWQDLRSGMYGNIYAARVSPSGVVLDPDGFEVAADTFDDAMPAVCFTGTDHLVVWQGRSISTWESNIYGALVSPAGTITRPRFVVSGAASDQMTPAVAHGPTNSLVAWEDTRLSGGLDMYAARVRADGTVLDPNGVLIAATSYDEQMPRVTSDAAGYKVLWRRWEYSDTTIFAVAQVDTAGDVTRVGDWFGLPGSDNGFDAVYGSGPELLLLFSCWTDTAFGRSYGADRLWGRFGQVPGIEQRESRELRAFADGATIVRGVLLLPRSLDPSIPRSLLDISGRKALDLHAGANDVRQLPPGVYFVREERAGSREQPAVGGERSAVHKVIVTR